MDEPEQEIAPGRVLVVEDDPLVCSVVEKILLDAAYDVVAVHCVQDGRKALTSTFNVAVLDVELPDGKCFDLFDLLRDGKHAPTSVVVMTGNPSRETIDSSIAVGVTEFLPKPFGPTALLAAVARALGVNQRWHVRLASLRQEDSVAPESGAETLKLDLEATEIARVGSALAAKGGLTEREAETLQLILAGYQNIDIATTLGISANTVKYHVRNLLTKLGMDSRTELFRYLLHGPGQER